MRRLVNGDTLGPVVERCFQFPNTIRIFPLVRQPAGFDKFQDAKVGRFGIPGIGDECHTVVVIHIGRVRPGADFDLLLNFSAFAKMR
jgi:hypothetical protein